MDSIYHLLTLILLSIPGFSLASVGQCYFFSIAKLIKTEGLLSRKAEHTYKTGRTLTNRVLLAGPTGDGL